MSKVADHEVTGIGTEHDPFAHRKVDDVHHPEAERETDADNDDESANEESVNNGLKKKFHVTPLMAILSDDLLLLLTCEEEGGGEKEYYLLSQGGVGYFGAATRVFGGPTSVSFPP